MEVQIIERTRFTMRLAIRGIRIPFANALRRIMLSEVPAMAIEDVVIIENSSVLNDEILAHRLGFIPIKTDLGQVHDVLIYIQDISKLKELEEGVRRTENLAGLGILASGVAHEINNPLQVILSGGNCFMNQILFTSKVINMFLQ